MEGLAIEICVDRSPSSNVHLKQILVPVDFSPCSENALRFALAMALRSGAELKLIHSVFLPSTTAGMLANPLEQMKISARRDLQELVHVITDWVEKEKYPPLKVTYEIRTGFAPEEVVRLAGEEKSDVIVMGTTGAGRVEGLLLGSTASNVLLKSKAPVLVVPDTATFHDIRKVAFATDLAEPDAGAVKDLIRFANVFSAKIDVLHVVPSYSDLPLDKIMDFNKTLEGMTDEAETEFHLCEADGRDVNEAIQNYLESNEVDVVAMLTRDRGFLGRLFHPSMTKRMAHKTAIPLLALHENKNA